MNSTLFIKEAQGLTFFLRRYPYIAVSLLSGLMLPLGFAPFHWAGLTILGLSLFFYTLQPLSSKAGFASGFILGLGQFGLGVSWVFVSIHHYGHLNLIVSGLITTLFILYLALFPAFVAYLYCLLKTPSLVFSACLFAVLWCIGEFVRANLLGGFPWLMTGTSMIDTPIKYVLPILGVYGASLWAALAATMLAASWILPKYKKYLAIVLCVIFLLAPQLLKPFTWSKPYGSPLSVGIVQANLSMRDKWDEALFNEIMQHYQKATETLLQDTKLIVLPESAFPLPTNFIQDELIALDMKAQEYHSAILAGILVGSEANQDQYYNGMIALGLAQGTYLKQHLVPFGEFIPKPFYHLVTWLGVPLSNMGAGTTHQSLIQVHQHSIASLICYELAYPNLLKHQLPKAQWIVSISDDGWFGHSFAVYQQVQMAQILSLLTSRPQILANNDGLSSIIDVDGQIIASSPAFKSDILKAMLQPYQGISPWVLLGDYPIILLCMLFLMISLIKKRKIQKYLDNKYINENN